MAQGVSLPRDWTPIDKVVIGGMGGSAIAGDLAADLAATAPTVPILVVRDRQLPFSLNGRSLFIACSYSGDTEETLALFHQALEAGARVIAISSGGTLSEEARSRGVPLLNVGVTGEPRGASAYSLILLLGALHQLGLLDIGEREVFASVKDMRQQVSQLEEDVPTPGNLAKQLAAELKDKLILVYGGNLYTGMARRWKSQFNENAKVWAFSETIPELLHNLVEAFTASTAIAQGASVLLLQPSVTAAAPDRHYQVVSDMLRRNGIPNRIIQGLARPPLSQLLSMLLLGDYVSYYLALLRGVDPSPTPTILEAKERLASLTDAHRGRKIGGR